VDRQDQRGHVGGAVTPARWVVWARKHRDGECRLGPLLNVARQFQLLKGVPRAAGFPSDAAMAMEPDHPNDMVLTDALFNNDRLIVASERLREVFTSRGAPAIEILPLGILDHRGRPAAAPYAILHPVDPVDCLDLAQCGPKRSSIDPAKITDVARLVLDDARVDPDRLIFRPLGFPNATLVRRDVAEAISAAGLTGMRWVELDAYPER